MSEPIKVGFTGTRHGCKPIQHRTLHEFLSTLDIEEAHHGDCIGADKQFHDLVAEDHLHAILVVHPPVDEACRAFCTGNVYREAKTHFARNRDIVNESDIVLACPPCDEWQPRGGTFFTMDYAIKAGKPLTVFWPDGRVERRP